MLLTICIQAQVQRDNYSRIMRINLVVNSIRFSIVRNVTMPYHLRVIYVRLVINTLIMKRFVDFVLASIILKSLYMLKKSIFISLYCDYQQYLRQQPLRLRWSIPRELETVALSLPHARNGITKARLLSFYYPKLGAISDAARQTHLLSTPPWGKYRFTQILCNSPKIPVSWRLLPRQRKKYFRKATVRWREVDLSRGRGEGGGGESIWEKERDRRTRGGYRRDKDGKLQAIWLIRLWDSKPGDRDARKPTIPLHSMRLPLPWYCHEERSTKADGRSRRGGSGVRYIHTARVGRLGFCRGNPAELRKEGFLFMR